MSKRSSIYFRLTKLLFLAALITGICFFLLDKTSIYLLNQYFQDTTYIERLNDKRIAQLQEYIRSNHLTTKDKDKLNEWVDRQAVVYMQIYKNNIRVYDSSYPDVEISWDDSYESVYYDWELYYTVTFEDGETDVFLYGFYEYQLYNWILVAELLICFLLFLGIVMVGIRKTMVYIRQLSREVEILEGGDLDCPITVKGKDELAVLAKGLDSMRKSFRSQVEQETYLSEANRKMITEMSHDMRTPLTSIMIYTEILKKGKYESQEQMLEYIEKIDRKTRSLKQLSEHLFEYSLISCEEKVQLEEPEYLETVFFDLLSETCSYLEQMGFQVTVEVEWRKEKVCVNTDYILRIFDNVTSNIVKYAASGEPVRICSVYEESRAGFFFENAVKAEKMEEESSHIGIQNVKNLIKRMEGVCRVEETHEQFRITLLFPHKILREI